MNIKIKGKGQQVIKRSLTEILYKKMKISYLYMLDNNIYTTCECGSFITNSNMSKHQKTKKHIHFIQKSFLCDW